MAISQEVSVFPFVVSPVAQDRVQFWAQFASRAVTQNDFDAVGWAYGAFWMESGAQEAYRRACAAVQQFGALSAVCWLDVVVSYLTTALERWRQVQICFGEESQAEPWWQDVCRQLVALSQLQSEIVDYVRVQCAASGLAVPEYCAAFLAQMLAHGGNH